MGTLFLCHRFYLVGFVGSWVWRRGERVEGKGSSLELVVGGRRGGGFLKYETVLRCVLII